MTEGLKAEFQQSLSELSNGAPLVVYKYRLRPAENLIEMPHSAQLLRVASQGSKAFVWALVVAKDEPTPRKIAVVPTGFEFTVDGPIEYIGTFTIQEPDEPELVFHAFDCGEVTSK